MSEKYTAIVLSAGSGSRMKSSVPKQYMDLLGKPVLYYSLFAFQTSDVDEIILVTGAKDIEYCRKQIVDKYSLTKVKHIVPGGDERYKSVYEGLKAAKGADYILIHDGARPMLDKDIITRSMISVKKDRACVVAVPVKETIKIVDEDNYAVSTPDRSTLWQVQTPQSFDYGILSAAYNKIYEDIESGKNVPMITDDAMIIEYATDVKVRIIDGTYKNIKVTTPEDMGVAEVFLKKM